MSRILRLITACPHPPGLAGRRLIRRILLTIALALRPDSTGVPTFFRPRDWVAVCLPAPSPRVITASVVRVLQEPIIPLSSLEDLAGAGATVGVDTAGTAMAIVHGDGAVAGVGDLVSALAGVGAVLAGSTDLAGGILGVPIGGGPDGRAIGAGATPIGSIQLITRLIPISTIPTLILAIPHGLRNSRITVGTVESTTT